MSLTGVAYNGTIVLPLQQKAVIPEENPIPVPFCALQIRHATTLRMRPSLSNQKLVKNHLN
jgi:hypothetical protein